MFETFAKKNADWMYTLFRVVVGAVFFEHGSMKLFGWFGAKGVAPLMSLFGLAGLIEVIGGLLLILGLWTRLVALVGGIEMLYALVMVHFKNGFNPLANGGEPALLFLAAFLVLFSHGAGRSGIDSKKN